jgi:Kef-type K+ transport system membrane component KefB
VDGEAGASGIGEAGASAETPVLQLARCDAPFGVDQRGRLRAGMALVARGEFSIVIAGLGAGLEPQLGPLSAAYVLFWQFSVPFSCAPVNNESCSSVFRTRFHSLRDQAF